MSSISYFTGLHVLTSDEFNNIAHKDPQGLYVIVDAPIPPHNWKHYEDGADPLHAADIGAIPNKSPIDLDASNGPFIFNILTGSSIWGDSVQSIAFYDGINSKYNNQNSPVILLGGDNCSAVTKSPDTYGIASIRNIIVANTPPTSEIGENGDIYIQDGRGIYSKHNGTWSLCGSSQLDQYMPKSGGTFTGPVTYAGSTGSFNVTSTAKNPGYFYSGNVAPTATNRLNYDGYFYATRVYNAYMADYAEVYSIESGFEPGMVVVIDPLDDNEVSLCYMECDDNAFGVISDNYAFCIGGEPDDTHAPIALAGKVPVLIDGECRKGDYLVTSSKKGHAKAVKHLDNVPRGCVIGRALENKKSDKNVVLCAILRM